MTCGITLPYTQGSRAGVLQRPSQRDSASTPLRGRVDDSNGGNMMEKTRLLPGEGFIPSLAFIPAVQLFVSATPLSRACFSCQSFHSKGLMASKLNAMILHTFTLTYSKLNAYR